MLSIFKRRRENLNLSWIAVDMHSHILPGLDDGCTELRQSLHLLERLQTLGLSQFYFTPHVFQDMYPNDATTIDASFKNLCASLSANIEMSYAAEYMVDNAFAKSILNHDAKLLTLPGNHVLIEMSYVTESKQIEKVIFDLLIAGYTPILAHPERYIFYQRSIERIKYLRDIGCLLQLNLLSMYGYYGNSEKIIAHTLADYGWVDLIGTDVHHEGHVRALEQGVKKENVSSYFKNCNIKNQTLFASNSPICKI